LGKNHVTKQTNIHISYNKQNTIKILYNKITLHLLICDAFTSSGCTVKAKAEPGGVGEVPGQGGAWRGNAEIDETWRTNGS